MKDAKIENILLQAPVQNPDAHADGEIDRLTASLDRLETELARRGPGSVTNTATNYTNASVWAILLAGAGAVFAALCLVVMMVEFSRQNADSIKEHTDTQAQLTDLRAWKDVHSNDLAMLKARTELLQEKTK